jgi:hypothetical protein
MMERTFYSLLPMLTPQMTLFGKIDNIHSLSYEEFRLKLRIKQKGKSAPFLNCFPFFRINPDTNNQLQG